MENVCGNSLMLWMLVFSLNLSGIETVQQIHHELSFDEEVQAVIWAYPLFQLMSRYEILTDPANCQLHLRGAALEGRFFHGQSLLNPRDRVITCPNNDNWYETAFLDLDKTNYTLVIPPIPDRYYSFCIYDSWTNVIKIINSKTYNGCEQRYIIANESFQPSEAEKPYTIISSTPVVWVLGRILAKEGEHVSAIKDIQDNLTLIPFDMPDINCIHPLAPQVAEKPDAQIFYSRIGRYLSRCRIPESKMNYVEWFKKSGCTPQGLTDEAKEQENFARLSRIHHAAIEIMTRAFFNDGERVNGWVTSFNCGNVIGNDALRAGFAFKSLGALTIEECIYFRGSQDSEKKKLTGTEKYILHFDADKLPPVDGFWSLSIYDQQSSFFVKNEINRFSIGDRTTGCTYNHDGSLDIIIQHDRPIDYPNVNWLPAPADDFYLILRFYHPRQLVYDRQYEPPCVRRTE